MAVTRATVWVANDILTAVALNAEFDLFAGANGQAVSFPRTAVADFNGQTLLLDADGDTTARADTNDQIDIAIGGTDTYKLTETQMFILGKRVLTTTDRAKIDAYLPRIAMTEARVAELESNNAFAVSQLTNF